MTNPWFRLYSEIIDDWKIKSIAFEDRWHYVAILCLKNEGELDKELTPEQRHRMLTIKLGVTGRDLEGLIKRLGEAGLISTDLQPLGWEDRQFRSDGDPSAAERARRYRERKRADVAPRDENEPVTRDVTRDVTDRHAPVTRLDTDTDTDTDTESESEGEESLAVPAPVADATPPCPHESIVELFNARCTAMPRVRELTDLRRKAIRMRWRENPDRQSIEWWRMFFDRVASSPFLCGSNERHWTADFDWLLKPANFVKVTEGKYDVAGPRIFSERTQRNIENLREWANGST